MWQDTYRSVFGFIHPPLHDPCAVAFVIAPQLFKVRELRVDIETVSPYTAGQTVCDVWRQTGRPANCRVAVTMDVAQFWDLQLAALAEADVASPLNRLTIPEGG
ncbi:Inosine/uridine-preferring nucleoside hydrolase domain-containing protein [Haematococcus lacustris]